MKTLELNEMENVNGGFPIIAAIIIGITAYMAANLVHDVANNEQYTPIVW